MRLDGYDTGGFYDEMFDASGQPRPEARYLLETIGSLGDGQLQRCQQAAERALVQLGITFNVYGDSAGTERPDVSDGGLPWEAVRQDLAGHARPDLLEAFEFSLASPFVPCLPALADYARVSFIEGRPIADASTDLMCRIHGDFRYEPKTTSVDTPLIEVFRSRRGVCQDCAHVMVGALRSLGLAARYVSGYLRSGALVGAEASHAWVAVCVPGSGWLELDPTNNVRPGTGHVTLAWGRDYGDVTPVKGIALGGGQQVVEVEVRVDPA